MSGGAVTVRARDFIARVRPRMFDKPIDLDAIVTLAATISRAGPDAYPADGTPALASMTQR